MKRTEIECSEEGREYHININLLIDGRDVPSCFLFAYVSSQASFRRSGATVCKVELELGMWFGSQAWLCVCVSTTKCHGSLIFSYDFALFLTFVVRNLAVLLTTANVVLTNIDISTSCITITYNVLTATSML
jgi:hypothetical protein